MATTLAWLSRFMPAMPIADRSAPIVVGARQTRRAASTAMETTVPLPATCTLKADIGRRAMTTTRKMIVRPASRMLSAISLGVFWRLAPSTMAIMRSRKVSPGSAVTCTISQSESTRVPPVTALRSPPLSRITGRALAGDGALVDGGGADDHLAVGRDQLARLDQDDVASPQKAGSDAFRGCVPLGCGQLVRHDFLAGFAQRLGLRPSPAFGQRLGEVGEDDREPEEQAR